MPSTRLAPFVRQFLAVCLLALHATSQADELRVLPDDGHSAELLRGFLRLHVHSALDRRLEEFEALRTPNQITEYQQRLRDAFLDSLGGFPPRTPLNPRVVGTVSADGYRIEKVIYESRPGFYVTANVYLPNKEPPYPGVLIPCGHTANGKAGYQNVAILLAQNGLAALCYDPVGQGERYQILNTDNTGKSLPEGRFGSTLEHSLTGVAPILLGQSLATYRIWDGIRSLDYLCGREDIDATRIGCTGNSGGGLMTSYLMALDERVGAAAPSCFVTTTRRKNESPGPGDAEQNVFGQIAYGMDHADYVLMRAPKPTLICAATQDFVPIEGSWEAFRQAKRLYTRMGLPERVDLIEADEKHGFSLHLRVGAMRWMRRWLLGEDDAVTEDTPDAFSDQELQCSPHGQVLLMNGARSLFEINQQTADALAAKRRKEGDTLSRTERIQRVRNVAGFRSLADLPQPHVETVGTVQRNGYCIKKLCFKAEDDFPLPALHFVPDNVKGRPVLFVAGDGKGPHALAGSAIERLVRSGQPVLAVDLRGFGETATRPWRYAEKYFGNNGAEYMIAYMLGRSLVGLRAEDVLVTARYLSSAANPAERVELLAIGLAAIPALHAAATQSELFTAVSLHQTLDSWQRVIDTPVAIKQLENTVHGALRSYDLPDLVKLCEGVQVQIYDPLDGQGHRL